MDFDDWRRINRSVTGALSELDTVARRMREVDSVTRNFREMDSAVRDFRERDSVARAIQEEMNAAASRPEMAIGASSLRELSTTTGGAYDQARRYLEVQDSIQRQLQRDFQKSKALGVTSMIRELASQTVIEDWRQSISEAAGRLSSAYALARSADFEEFNRRADLLKGLTSVSPVISMLARELAGSVVAGTLTPALAGGFGADLLDYIEDAEAVDSEEAIEEFLKGFLAWLLVQAQRLPGTKLSGEAILGIFLTVASVLYGQYTGEVTEKNLRKEIQAVREDSREGHESTLKEMREMEARLTATLAQAQGDDGDEYIVIKDANLRKGPGKEFESLKVLPPNLQVEEVEKEGEWSLVRYFDYVEGETREGWIATALLVAKQGGD